MVALAERYRSGELKRALSEAEAYAFKVGDEAVAARSEEAVS